MRAYAYIVAATGNTIAWTDTFDIYIPYTNDSCSVHLINRGVTVEGRNATVEFDGVGANDFGCYLESHYPYQTEPCTFSNRMIKLLSPLSLV